MTEDYEEYPPIEIRKKGREYPSINCGTCLHYDSKNDCCPAYPDTIPNHIWDRDDDNLWDEPCNPKMPRIRHKNGNPEGVNPFLCDGPHAFGVGFNCMLCKHFKAIRNEDGCEAFPNWIPESVIARVAEGDTSKPCNPKRPEIYPDIE